MRAGPGWSLVEPKCACASASTTDRLRRSLVSSPATSRKSVAWVTGSNAMTRPFGSVSDIAAFSPG
jgi:hypothetical protein